MILLRLSDQKLEHSLTLTAQQKAVSLEEAAQLAIEVGLRLLVKTDNLSPAIIDPAVISQKQLRQQELQTLIVAHWETKNDAQIGRLATPPALRSVICKLRQAMQLHRTPIKRRSRKNSLKQSIVPKEFTRMVLHDGYTMTEYLEEKQLKCTKQYLSIAAVELGLKCAPEDRAPEWEVRRKARKLQKPQLADKDWLTTQVGMQQSMAAFAAELGISRTDLLYFLRRHEINVPSKENPRVATTSLQCTNCKTAFVRHTWWVDRHIKTSRHQPPEFFCSPSCSGKWNSERTASPAHQKSLRQLQKEQARASRQRQRSTYIHDNWERLSDKELAKSLATTVDVVIQHRIALGLRRT